MKTKQAKNRKMSHWVLGAMVSNRTVCASIAAIWERNGLFPSQHANLIATWCVEHFRRYNATPGHDIQTLFESWVQRGNQSPDEIDLVERMLVNVNEYWTQAGELSVDYILDRAQEIFEGGRIRRVLAAAENKLDDGQIDEAREVLEGSSRIELGTSSIVKPGEDTAAWEEAFNTSRNKVLFNYMDMLTYDRTKSNDALDRFMGSEMSRDSFVAFMAPNKRGKSWWVLDAAYRATMEGRRVAYFEAGDLSKSQVMLRMAQRALRRPLSGKPCRWPVSYEDPADDPQCEARDLKGCERIEAQQRWRKIQRKEDRFRLSWHPNSTLSVSHVQAQIHDWETQGWVADMIAIDYADIMMHPPNKDARDAVNETWKQMRRMSQEMHCLVLTATQADAASFTKTLIRRSNFTDDRRKLDHVTAMIGINVTDDEKKVGVSRLNFVTRRHDHYVESGVVNVVGCLDIACPAMLSVSKYELEQRRKHR